jgi:hypothetical protein
MKSLVKATENQFQVIVPDKTRRLSDVLDHEKMFATMVWYNRHQIKLERLENGDVKVVEPHEASLNPGRLIPKDIWVRAKKAAKEAENTYGLENLGPWDDFDLGMIKGKLSALRWIMGSEWDDLDT